MIFLIFNFNAHITSLLKKINSPFREHRIVNKNILELF